MIALENSDTFKRTHSVISDLEKIDDWTMEEQIRLIKIALDNSQIRYLLGDYDVKRFYENLLDNMENETSEIENLKTELLHEIKKKKRFS